MTPIKFSHQNLFFPKKRNLGNLVFCVLWTMYGKFNQPTPLPRFAHVRNCYKEGGRGKGGERKKKKKKDGKVRVVVVAVKTFSLTLFTFGEAERS